MTTIAVRDGILAADSACTLSGILIGSVRKLGRAHDGSLIAAAGATIACAALISWAEQGMDPKDKPSISDEDFKALIVRPDRTVALLGAGGTEAQVDAPFHAIGSGWQIALTAMAMGATAEQAVLMACQYDTCSRGPVQTMRIEPAASLAA